MSPLKERIKAALYDPLIAGELSCWSLLLSLFSLALALIVLFVK